MAMRIKNLGALIKKINSFWLENGIDLAALLLRRLYKEINN
jgi:hypothetical protein